MDDNMTRTESGIYVPKDSGVFIPKDYQVFVKPTQQSISRRKLENLLKIAEIKKYYQNNPVKFISEILGAELFDSQAYLIQRSWNCPNNLWVCSRGLGKALDLETNIPTPIGNRKMRDIQAGDFVYDENGNTTKVINVSPVYYNHKCYQLYFRDGEKIIADADHIWNVYTEANLGMRDEVGFITTTTEEMFKAMLNGVQDLSVPLSGDYSINRVKNIVSIVEVDSVPVKCITVDTKRGLYLCGHNETVTHNSSITDLFIMAKGMLFNNYWAYIASGTGSQAELTFATLERIANRNIESMAGLTDIFKQEVEVKAAAGDGFVHSNNGWYYTLYNGSFTKTLNSNVDKKRGFTGNILQIKILFYLYD